ncbi:MAG: phosphatidate cytidylyltransferase [Phycisphaerae bacterium]
MDPSLRNRLTFGPIMLGLLIGLLVLDWAVEYWTRPLTSAGEGLKGVGLLLLLLPLLPPATIELARIFALKFARPYRIIAGAGSTLLVLHAFCTQFPVFKPVSASLLMFIVVAIMLVAALRRSFLGTSRDAIIAMAGTLLAAIYVGGLAWFLMALRVRTGAHFSGTTFHVVMILLAVKFTDIGAYFSGKALGKHKMIPWLSPGKTWEGLVGGLMLAGVVGAACAPFIHDLHWYTAVYFGILIGGFGQLGDLLESLMKRDADVKDSGQLIPGFGGVLDVIDSPLLAFPVAYLLFSLGS